jgi:hypothetical protein
LLVILASSCCARETQVSVSTAYRLPLKEPEDVACFRRCQEARLHGPERYAQCLEACPGVEIEARSHCAAADVPPETECVEVVRHKTSVSHESPTLAAFLVGALAGTAATVTVMTGAAKKRDPAQQASGGAP